MSIYEITKIHINVQTSINQRILCLKKTAVYKPQNIGT